MTENFLTDRDPGDEDVPNTAVTGLCVRPWCDDAALPGEDLCADCLGDVERMLEELESAA